MVVNFVVVHISQYISNKINRIVFLFLGGGICGVEKGILYFITQQKYQSSFRFEAKSIRPNYKPEHLNSFLTHVVMFLQYYTTDLSLIRRAA